MSIGRRILLSSLVALAGADASAVALNPEGLGQALIYPYYTVRSAQGNPFNTYVSIVNHSDDAKALRVRFREGRNSREVLAFNLYLSPYDAWAGAVVPTASGARLVTADNSCTDPAIRAGVDGIDLNPATFQGANDDGNGTSQDRTREGFIEILEMATLTGSSAAALTVDARGVPVGCAAMRSTPPTTAAPTGGLSGTLTLINVASGLDFTLNATALADLSSDAFFRSPSDPYPGFDAAEITPASLVVDGGFAYRSLWARGVDAVSAVLMRASWTGEYVLDTETRSRTDVALTLPTRHAYVGSTPVRSPFGNSADWSPSCSRNGLTALGEPLEVGNADRESRRASWVCDSLCPPPPPTPRICASTAVARATNAYAHTHESLPDSSVVGSTTLGLAGGRIVVVGTFVNGWVQIVPLGQRLTSLPGSQRIDARTGAVQAGRHEFHGLPGIGFTVRTFSNGTLACSEGSCQGNYGGAFPLGGRRRIETLP